MLGLLNSTPNKFGCEVQSIETRVQKNVAKLDLRWNE